MNFMITYTDQKGRILVYHAEKVTHIIDAIDKAIDQRCIQYKDIIQVNKVEKV